MTPNTPGSSEDVGARSRDPERKVFGRGLLCPGGRGDALGRSKGGIWGTGVEFEVCVIVLDRVLLEAVDCLSYPYGSYAGFCGKGLCTAGSEKELKPP